VPGAFWFDSAAPHLTFSFATGETQAYQLVLPLLTHRSLALVHFDDSAGLALPARAGRCRRYRQVSHQQLYQLGLFVILVGLEDCLGSLGRVELLAHSTSCASEVGEALREAQPLTQSCRSACAGRMGVGSELDARSHVFMMTFLPNRPNSWHTSSFSSTQRTRAASASECEGIIGWRAWIHGARGSMARLLR